MFPSPRMCFISSVRSKVSKSVSPEISSASRLIFALQRQIVRWRVAPRYATCRVFPQETPSSPAMEILCDCGGPAAATYEYNFFPSGEGRITVGSISGGGE